MTIGQLLGGVADDAEPSLPGFAMADTPPELPPAFRPPPQRPPPLPIVDDRSAASRLETEYERHDLTREPITPSPDAAGGSVITPADDDFESAHAVYRYEARINVLEAFQYQGALASAPDWVDRNWLGWGDHDMVRGIPAGPCLRVPQPYGGDVVCRVGDYVVRQEIRHNDRPSHISVEVWAKDAFEHNFLVVPVRSSPPRRRSAVGVVVDAA